MAKDALQWTGDVIDKHGPRLFGADACLDAAKTIADSFGEACDRVETQDFEAHPSAFLGFIRVLTGSYLLSVVFMCLNLPVASCISSALGIVNFIFEYLLYFHFSDRFYPKYRGRNVIGFVEPTDEVKNVVLVSGHHDSAQIFNFYEDGKAGYQVREIRGMVIFLFYFGVSGYLSVQAFKTGNVFAIGFPSDLRVGVAAAIGLALSWFVYPLWWFLNDEGCPGAGDNLASVAMDMEVARYFRKNRLRHTRVMAVSFDGEECGLRGARAFWAKYADELRKYNTWNFNADCPYYHDELRFLTKDINWAVNLDVEMANKAAEIARGMGVSAIVCPIAYLAGATDAGEAARAGFKATTLLSIPFTNKCRDTVYHTRNDTVEHVEPQAIEQAIAVMIKFTQDVDTRKT